MVPIAETINSFKANHWRFRSEFGGIIKNACFLTHFPTPLSSVLFKAGPGLD